MIKVFKVSDLIKYSIKIIIPLTIIFIIVNIFGVKVNLGMSYNTQNPLLFCLDESVNEIKVINSKEKEKENKLKYIISHEFNILENDMNNGIKIAKENIEESTENNNEVQNTSKEENGESNSENIIVERPELNAKTEVVGNNVNPKFTNEYNGVKIDNATNYSLTEEMLNPENINVNKDKVIIYHTHTCESYTPTEAYQYESSGNFRTTNLNFSVSRVGDELENQLKSYGCNVIHNKAYHDYPAYNGSYSRSLQTVEEIISSNTDADIVIDLHRDAIADSTYAPKVKIGDEYASQLMFVIGSDVANSINSNWNENLKFAIKVQQKANELYPGLFKPIILRNSEYNQHVAKAACIIEVGATGNTLEESIASMKYLARIIEEIE